MDMQKLAVYGDDQHQGPSLAEAIETRKFLGREFLAWIWFESQLFESTFAMVDDGEKKTFELWPEKRLVLERLSEAGKEKDVMTGLAPTGTEEALEAIRQGKWPTSMKLGLRLDEQEFAFAIDGDSLALSQVKIPALLKGDGDDPFYERMNLIEKLERIVEGLYLSFLARRLDSLSWDMTRQAMINWANGIARASSNLSSWTGA